ncbi:dentin sialophosphoprotein isoform X1 [Poecilia formosa]|uniref:dentin sialophosphoprotein isoform X1 n=1 Tax=Poecilia formosa TaxID=48698 RepID=UPI0007B92C6D|nr:PREDICTED: dentin sialophosphoprotein-like isoform X1 [Poecilia formosa]XP_016527053.1 PREDICTED: dentin sialophosphoprotein-like isoform X1 [Poecilia formosa]
MDDLDHSIHIAENDWISFYDDSEECNLLQASLAFPDDSSLSDSEDSGNFNTGQQETNGSTDSNTSEESCTGGILVEQLFQSDATCMKQGEISVSFPETNTISTTSADEEIAQEILAKTSDSNTNTLQTNPLSNYSSEGRGMLSRDGAAQMTSDLKSNKKPDLLSCKQAVPSASEPDATGRAEKERWFVTVNDNLAWRRGRSTSVKKKLKQKNPGEAENVQNSDTERGREQSRGIQLNRNKESGELSEEPLSSRSVAAMNRDKWEPGSSGHTSYDSFSPSPTALERLQCSELRHGAEFSSAGSWDSDSYLSAVESVEEAQHPLEEHLIKRLPLECPLSPTCDNQNVSLTLPIDATAANYDGYATPELPFTPPSPEIPDENSTYGNDTCSETHLPPSPSGGSREDQLSPDSTQSLCSATDSPETFAKAAGQAQPVYAISAFWDEVEKLTINDILQIRMGISCRLTEETAGPDTSDLPTDPSQFDPLDNSMMDTSDAADSDYFTQPDESKRDRSVCEFSSSDFEEESWQFANLSKNSSPDLQNKSQRSDSCLFLDEDDSTDYERRETPVALDQSLDCQDFQNVISCQRRMTKSRSMYNVQALTKEDVAPLPSLSIDQNDLPLSRDQPLQAFLSHTDLQDYRISFPEIFEYFFTEYDNTPLQFLSVGDPEEMFVSRVFHSPLCTFGKDPWAAPFQCSTEKPIPIFSCSRPAVQDLTFPNPHVFLSTDCEEVDKVSPMRLMSHSFFHASPHRSSGAAGVDRSHSWKSFLSLRKIRFPDKGSICCSESGAWIFPVDTEDIRMGSQNQAVTSFSERRACLDFSQEFRELEEQCWISETVWTSRSQHATLPSKAEREGLFSRVKQSDMCLVCIAFASWVLRSSNPEAADAWKAALLANVSALSAIQYLRQYMTMENPPRDDL